MSLGVLNNLNATAAEYNLNNTSNSLSKTLQQLSSGSKINSGSDDAAGLSLVNGLQANQTALSQSTTNATEGVGLLQVADGALSQVTSLLDRAVTLATEVSNGTLNTSQATAANEEYQSILSEVNNIGSTTTYNQQAVFGSTVNVYSGDSTTTGASVNSLKISSLSSSNLGDSSGSITYNKSANSGDSVTMDFGTSFGSTGTASVISDGTYSVNYTDASGVATKYSFTVASGDISAASLNGTATTVTASTSATLANVATQINTDTGLTATAAVSSSNDTTLTLTASATTADSSYDATNLTVSNLTATNSTTSATSTGVATGSVATITYSASAGTDLSNTDLSNEADATSALTALNGAIANVAAQDGYIGAQINTLTSVSSVLSTQQTNVQSAQNAVQATDYATASSNMSKYEILSQTGISALAQANSVQQEVTKLLQ